MTIYSDTIGSKRGTGFGSLAACLYVGIVATPAIAATQAGTAISNVATLTIVADGTPQSVPSNTVSLITAELLDVTIAADRATVAVRSNDMPALGFLVTNTGNGVEDFTVAVASDNAGVAVTRIAIDSNNDGVYDAATDQLLEPAGLLSLTPGQQQRVFVLIAGEQVTAQTRVTATVTARSGSGAPGTIIAGAGDNSGDAVIGRTGATATTSSLLTPAAGLPSLVKSQSVFAPDGSSNAVRGAIVTYRLAATFTANARGVVIDDPIPAGTDYVPGSLSLDDAALTDAADGDAGGAEAAAIRVTLGDIAPGTRTIQFSVKIQ